MCARMLRRRPTRIFSESARFSQACRVCARATHSVSVCDAKTSLDSSAGHCHRALVRALGANCDDQRAGEQSCESTSTTMLMTTTTTMPATTMAMVNSSLRASVVAQDAHGRDGDSDSPRKLHRKKSRLRRDILFAIRDCDLGNYRVRRVVRVSRHQWALLESVGSQRGCHHRLSKHLR